MKFSVLLSLYNKESPQFLMDCLVSIRDNSISPDQIIIVYDGPINEELDSIVVSFTDTLPIEIIRIEVNVGLGNALNYGLNYIRNNVVFRMDTDDKCHLQRFEKQLSFMKENPDIDILGSAISEYDETMSHYSGTRFTAENHIDIINYAKARNPFNHMTVVFKKDSIISVGGYQHHYAMEDYNLWLRLIAAGYKTHNLPESLVYVRAGEGLLNRRKGWEYVLSEFKIARLKYAIGIDTLPSVIRYSSMRLLPRLLPVTMLKYIYKKLRK